MAVTMHAKSDSEVTASSSPPEYTVQSPSHSHSHSHSQLQDVEKMSYGSSPINGSPAHPYPYHYQYHCSPIHHSRESSTSRFSDSLKNSVSRGGFRNVPGWKKLGKTHEDDEEEDDDVDGSVGGYKNPEKLRFYVAWFLFFFVLLFTIFSLILWAASTPYQPHIFIKKIVLSDLNVQAGMDNSGIPTDMLTLNSTVKMFYRNPATFFGVHVTATPFQFHYFGLKLASGQMNKFYQSRKSERILVVVVRGHQVPLYGGIPVLSGSRNRGGEGVTVPVNLTFVMRSRANILGRLVKPKFYANVLCQLSLTTNHLPKPINIHSCVYR